MEEYGSRKRPTIWTPVNENKNTNTLVLSPAPKLPSIYHHHHLPSPKVTNPPQSLYSSLTNTSQQPLKQTCTSKQQSSLSSSQPASLSLFPDRQWDVRRAVFPLLQPRCRRRELIWKIRLSLSIVGRIGGVYIGIL